MNILVLSGDIIHTGVGQYISQLSSGLIQKGHHVVLAAPDISRTDIPSAAKTIRLCNLGWGKSVLKYLSQLHRVIHEFKIEVVHCNQRKPASAMRVYQMLYGKIPVVFTCHMAPYPNNWLKRLLGYYGHKTIAVSSEAREWMIEEVGIDPRRVDLITHGVDHKNLIPVPEDKAVLKERFFKERFNLRVDGFETRVIALHSRLSPSKGIDLFIDAFAKLAPERRKNLQVVLTGEGSAAYCNELRAQIDRMGVSGNFHFAGWTDSCSIFQVADLMVLPSRREGFSLACLEAFIMKVPVIRTRTGGYADMKDYCVGISPNDIMALYGELVRWIDNPESFGYLVPAAYDFAMKEGTLAAMTDKTIATYQDAIGLCGKAMKLQGNRDRL